MYVFQTVGMDGVWSQSNVTMGTLTAEMAAATVASWRMDRYALGAMPSRKTAALIPRSVETEQRM